MPNSPAVVVDGGFISCDLCGKRSVLPLLGLEAKIAQWRRRWPRCCGLEMLYTPSKEARDTFVRNAEKKRLNEEAARVRQPRSV